MASKTTNYGLNKHSPQDFYNVEARNENWDKIDETLAATDPTKITAKAEPADGDGVMIADSADGGKAKRLLWSNVKAALGKLFVPLARKVNGKALSADVTLTGDDIAMGADDAESLRAAMAKRLINYGTEFASKDTILDAVMACKTSCSFFSYAGSRLFDANDRPELGAEYQYLVLMDDISGPRRTVIAYSYSAGNVFLRSVWNKKWQTDDWFPLATRKSPEVHNFPLVDGYTDLGCKYFRTQENVVSFAGEVMRTSGFRGFEPFAVLPEGFRPDHTIVVPALLYPSFTPTTIIINSNGEICETITASDKSLYMQATFVAG